MPRLLEKDDVMQTDVSLGRAEKVWSEQLVTGPGDMTFRLPEGGSYQVILLKVNSSTDQERSVKKILVKSISAVPGLTIPSLSATVQNFISRAQRQNG